MLTIYDSDNPWTRRQILSAGSLAVGGLSLSSLIAAESTGRARANLPSVLTGKSVIFLFQQGGPSQFETFDPKPNAPSGTRTVDGVIQTSLPGVLLGENLPQLAQCAHLLTVVRSYQTGNATHNIRPIVGPESLNANIGALYSRVAGATHPVTAMPSNAVLLPQAVSSEIPPGEGRGDLAATGTIGAAFAPFVPGGTGQLLQNLKLNLSADRFRERQDLRQQLDKIGLQHTSDPQFQKVDRNQQQACDVLLSGSVARALDLAHEDPAVLARYDTSRYATHDGWRKVDRGKRGYYAGHARSLGKSLLLARRLCEAGCGFVTVHSGYEGVWDMHADGNNLNMHDGMQAVGLAFDHAVAAFVADLEASGLSEKILLVATGEMGRTPHINRQGGRDHWAKLTPLLLYGAGMPRGRVIGQSSRDGGEPATDAATTAHLISTILQTVLDPAELRLQPALSVISRLADLPPIPGLG
ncbi:MAG: DUF1501 domain-containing protein [Planctomycetes bacterium]|nr:DUF1501 domain-containing protein [Planctomycetota bacterium]